MLLWKRCSAAAVPCQHLLQSHQISNIIFKIAIQDLRYATGSNMFQTLYLFLSQDPFFDHIVKVMTDTKVRS